jgi:UDP-N-acetylmuramoyl-tripeptide--D-alanyl-D-alanine ligase
MSFPMDARDTASLATKRRLARWPLVRVAECMGAELRYSSRFERADVETKQVLGAALDSRRLRAGELFIPLPGENVDGHDYIVEAQAHGAAASLFQRDREDSSAIEATGPLLVVDDPEISLQNWGASRRDAWGGTCVGITGTNGKTTTKDLLALCLETAGLTLATEGNHNNQLGVPLTLTHLSDEHRFAVIEMGTNHRGEICRLAEWARPTCGIITHVGPAHLEGLGSLEEVCREKADLAAAIPEDGFLIQPADQPMLDSVLDECGVKARRVRFALEGEADLVAENVTSLGPAGISFRVEGFPLVRIRLAGVHNVRNALAALACTRELGLDPGKVAAALEQAVPPSGRIEPVVAGGVALLLDHYNSNPDSAVAALATLKKWPAKRRFAALGEMKELGDYSMEGHREVGAAAHFVDGLFVVGEDTAHVAEGARAAGLKEECVRGFPSNQELGEELAAMLTPGDALLIKGSRGAHMEEVVDIVRQKLSDTAEKEQQD